MSYIFFSDEEKQRANDADIASFLISKGEALKRSGKEYTWESPTGKVSIRGNEWYSQYERVGGGAIKFVQKFYGLSYPETVRELLGSNAGTIVQKNKKEKKQVELIIPEKNKDMRRVYGYLCNERLIDKEIINAFVKSGLIYEDAKYHNVVFLGKDESGTIRHIQKRTTSHKSDFKGNVAGSDAEYSFRYIGTSDKLYVFEAPIDMLAYITLHKKDWKQHSYVALCSTAECSAMQIINKYSNIQSIYLCLDHDSAGIDGAYRIAESIHANGEQEVWRIMPKNKDWDEDLKELHGKEFIPSSEPVTNTAMNM